MKHSMKTMLASSAALALACAMMLATPLMADSLTVNSNLGDSAAVDSNGPNDAALQTGDTTGLTFSSSILSLYGGGSWISLNQTTPPAGTVAVSLGGGDGGPQNSGFVEASFMLPTGFSSASIAGEASADEVSYVFLNGNYIGQTGTVGVNASNDALFSSINPSYFVAGQNTLLFSIINTSGIGGVEFYGDVNYTSATPEPSSLLLLGSGLVGLAGMVRRKIGLRA